MTETEYEVKKPVSKKDLEDTVNRLNDFLEQERARNIRLVDRIRKLESRLRMYEIT